MKTSVISVSSVVKIKISLSVSERQIMNHFMVKTQIRNYFAPTGWAFGKP